MAVAAITPDYTGERLDRVENFHGNIVVYVGWDRHLMFCSPIAFATPPAKLRPRVTRWSAGSHRLPTRWQCPAWRRSAPCF